jgi:hypothetical protein
MPWPMSCPSGEGRRHGEGAELSHWASITLSVAVSLGADLLRSAFLLGLLAIGYWLLAIGYGPLPEPSSLYHMTMTIQPIAKSQQPRANSQ